MGNLCKYGEEQKINRGMYFMCSLIDAPCMCVRYCNTDSCFKMFDASKVCPVKSEKIKIENK